MEMMRKNRHAMARLAALLAALAVLLAIISGIIGKNIVLAQTSYMTLAVVLLLFAIYLRLGTLSEK